jgi:lauroyl/myristoyl acyltransferase
MDGRLTSKKLREIERKNLIYRKWRPCLQYAWPNIVDRYQNWVFLEGEEHLNRALDAGRGAILLAGHSYGFGGMATRVLAQRGHPVLRAGMGLNSPRRLKRQGNGLHPNWRYLSYHGDRWHRIRVLNQMRQALAKNAVLHFGIRGFPQGDPDLEIDFCYKRFFIDAQLLRLIELLNAPVLPCFAVCDDRGRIVVKIYPALAASVREIMAVFGPLYARYLKEFPENSNIWSRVVRQQEF